MFRLELPWPPSINHYWRSVPMGRHVRVLLSKGGRSYRDAVRQSFINSGLPMQKGALWIKMILYCPDWRARDQDNLGKAVFDSLVHAGAIGGDEFICSSICEKRKSADGEGRVIVEITQLENGVVVKPSGAWLN